MTSGVPVLMYHSVTDNPPASTRPLSVRPVQMAHQLEFLRDHGYVGLTFADLCERARAGADLPDRPVVLTFDDGYADTHEAALPLLVTYGFPATVFVTTGWLRDAGSESAGRPPDRMMTWSQVKELVDSGIEVAAHSHSHPELDQLDDGTLRAELGRGKALLEQRLGVDVPSLAYPFGYFSRRVAGSAEAAGYRQAATVANSVADVDAIRAGGTFTVPRLTVRRSTSPKVFGRIASGHGTHRIFRVDRALTGGWLLVRRSRAVLRSECRG